MLIFVRPGLTGQIRIIEHALNSFFTQIYTTFTLVIGPEGTSPSMQFDPAAFTSLRPLRSSSHLLSLFRLPEGRRCARRPTNTHDAAGYKVLHAIQRTDSTRSNCASSEIKVLTTLCAGHWARSNRCSPR